MCVCVKERERERVCGVCVCVPLTEKLRIQIIATIRICDAVLVPDNNAEQESPVIGTKTLWAFGIVLSPISLVRDVRVLVRGVRENATEKKKKRT